MNEALQLIRVLAEDVHRMCRCAHRQPVAKWTPDAVREMRERTVKIAAVVYKLGLRLSTELDPPTGAVQAAERAAEDALMAAALAARAGRQTPEYAVALRDWARALQNHAKAIEAAGADAA